MTTDNYVPMCFRGGGIVWISPCNGMFCATLEIDCVEKFRVFSDRGIGHLLGNLAAVICGDAVLQHEIDTLYPYPLGPLSKHEQDLSYQTAIKGILCIFLIKDVVHVEQYIGTMDSLSASPKPSARRAHGATFAEAIMQLHTMQTETVACIQKSIY